MRRNACVWGQRTLHRQPSRQQPESSLAQHRAHLPGRLRRIALGGTKRVRRGTARRDFVSLLAAPVPTAAAHGNLTFDAQIAALYRAQGIPTILTNVRDPRRFRHMRVRLLGELAWRERSAAKARVPARTRKAEWSRSGEG